MKVIATYIAKKDSLGFETGKQYILTIGVDMITQRSIVYAERENIRAKYNSLKAFFLNFDKVNIIHENEEPRIMPSENLSSNEIRKKLSVADEVAKICGYKNQKDFYKKGPSLVEIQLFEAIVKDRAELKETVFAENKLGLSYGK